MQFGSNEMKDLLILAYNEPNMYEKAMIELHETVKAYTISKIQKGFLEGEIHIGSKAITTELIEYQDYDDIVGDVFCGVVLSLERFIDNITQNDYTEAQRQAWLRRIIYNTIAKYLKKKNKDLSTLSITEIKNETDEELYGNDFVFYDIKFEDLLRNIVRVACLAPSKPEKIMAYIFNVIIFREISGHKHNGAAQATSNYMNGKRLYVLKNSMLESFKQIFNVTITVEDIEPLVEVLGDNSPSERGKEICEVTPKKVADWSNRIKTHIFKYRTEIFGEEGESNVRKK